MMSGADDGNEQSTPGRHSHIGEIMHMEPSYLAKQSIGWLGARGLKRAPHLAAHQVGNWIGEEDPTEEI